MKWLRRLPEAPVTSALLVANLAVYAAMALTSRHAFGFDNATLILSGANVACIPQEVSAWRWLTAAFIHVNLLHIAMNMWVLAQIGVLSERAIGRGLFAASYVATGAFGNFVSSLVSNLRHRPITSAGASGAIMGLIGIATVLAWRTGQRALARALLTNVAFVLVLGFAINLDNAAHIGGFVLGALVGLVRSRVSRPASRAVDATLIVASAALSATAFALVISYHGAR